MPRFTVRVRGRAPSPFVRSDSSSVCLLGASPPTLVRRLSKLADTGIRASELCRLRVHDLVDRERHDYIKVRGKGEKERLVPVPPATASARSLTHNDGGLERACGGDRHGDPGCRQADDEGVSQVGRFLHRGDLVSRQSLHDPAGFAGQSSMATHSPKW
ncbi:MAG: tyrosine-type recombinase/integrase [Actinobacteria bacterium]|nr:tyrosine-type recombinase/integrase [Actinomycetota bacterium]